jgi:hypothetical protein
MPGENSLGIDRRDEIPYDLKLVEAQKKEMKEGRKKRYVERATICDLSKNYEGAVRACELGLEEFPKDPDLEKILNESLSKLKPNSQN